MARSSLLLAALLMLGACVGMTGAVRSLGTEAVHPAYAAGGGQYDDGATIAFLVRAFEHDGRVGFCGLRTAHSMTGRTRYLNGFVAGAAILRLAGDRIRQGLAMLPEARFAPDMTGATARCYLTALPWRAAYDGAEPEVRIPRMEFPGGDEGSPASIVFRQAPVDRPFP